VKIITDRQRTPEWRAARLGRLTSSRVDAMLSTTKKGDEAAGRRNLRVQLVLERLTGASQEDGYVSRDMERGNEIESDAFAAYEAQTGELAMPTGFIAHDDLLAGCSPDGVIGEFAGLIELKCPKSATHLEYLRSKTIPLDYFRQIQHQLWITGAAWCDFVSFDPRFPPPLRLLIERVTRDEAAMKAHELLVRMFLAEVDKELAEIEQMAGVAAA
jgi:YqaJ-like viral recombinase domain